MEFNLHEEAERKKEFIDDQFVQLFALLQTTKKGQTLLYDDTKMYPPEIIRLIDTLTPLFEQMQGARLANTVAGYKHAQAVNKRMRNAVDKIDGYARKYLLCTKIIGFLDMLSSCFDDQIYRMSAPSYEIARALDDVSAN